MRHIILIVLLEFVFTPTSITSEEEDGAEYLKSVMSKLQSERSQSQPQTMWKMQQDKKSDFKIMGPTPLPPIMDAELEEGASQQTNPNVQLPPAAPLSKDELHALYQAAINKGAVLDLSGMTSGTVHGMHALQNLLGNMNKEQMQNLLGPMMNKDIPQGQQEEQAFYYYFYPIKSFEKAQTQSNEVKQQTTSATTNKPNATAQMAAMVPTAMMIIDSGGQNKSVEPLFMAIASFVGMALMFAFSVLFLPKFGNLRSRGISALKHAPDELASLTKLVLDGIDGKDCSERIACEVGRAVRTMRLDKKPLRVLEILLPPSMGKQLQMIRKAAARNQKCNFIPCKWKGNKKKTKS